MACILKTPWNHVRRFAKAYLLLTVILILGSMIYAIWAIDRYVNHKSPELIFHVQQRYGRSCTIGNLHYVFPFSIRASDIVIFRADNRIWLKAADITARISPLNYLLSGKLSPKAVSSLEASNLEAFFYHQDASGWDLSGVLHPPGSQAAPSATENRPLKLTVNNLTLFFRTDKREVKQSYTKMVIRASSNDSEGYFELMGDGGERLNVSFQRKSGAFDIRAESFRLALLSPFLGSSVPLDDISITAHAKGTPDKNGPLSFALSGIFSVQEKKKVLLPDFFKKDTLVKFNARGKIDKDQTDIKNVEIAIGGQSVSINGRVTNKRRPQIDLLMNFTDFSIGKAVEAVPMQFYPDLPGLKVKGSLSGKFHFFMDMEDPQSLKYNFDGKYEPIKVLFLSTKIDIKALASSFRHTVHRPDRKQVSFIVGENNPEYIPLRSMPQSVVPAVITAEDGGFFKHRGFSTLPIRDSFVENLKAGRVVRGASTITMQLAKNLYLRPERTFSRKFEESFITMALEQTLTKERIMEIYLNIIEWGDGIYGIGPAAQYYFNKSAIELTPVESAFLASIIPYPRKKWGHDPLSNIGEGWRQYLQLILCRMYERGGAEVVDLRKAGVEDSRIARLVRNKGVDMGGVISPPPDGD
ncbi:MAG: biosynthetic peptidoglycan transglycosylase [Syntrophales bacterium]